MWKRKVQNFNLRITRNVCLKKLNDFQRIVVQSPFNGVTICSAGPGSGKTSVLAYRIVYLLDQITDLNTSIIALTFSNKARQELKNRVEEYMNHSESNNIKIHTFHSFCSNLLRTYGKNYLGKLVNNRLFDSKFSILNEDDSIRCIKKILKEKKITNLKEDHVFSQIIKLKENVITEWTQQFSTLSTLTSSSSSVSSSSSSSSSLLKNSNSNHINILLNDPIIQEISQSYEQILRNNNVVDFTDLLILTWKLLRQYPIIRHSIQNRYKHILIDEYQDTNHIQYELTKLLYQPPSLESLILHNYDDNIIDDEFNFNNTIDENFMKQNLCNNNNNNKLLLTRSLFVVGDINQSIYSWRGAEPENLLLLQKDFTDSLKYELKQNYRCSPQISTIANTVLGKVSTTSILNKNESDYLPVYIYAAKDDITQAEFICRSLKTMTGKSRAILYRTNAQSHALEVALMQSNIKYKIRGSKRFVDRKEVQDILSYLRLIVNPRNIIACQRNINTPPRGIGEKSQTSFFKWMEECNKEFTKKNHLPPTILDYLYAIRLLHEEELNEDNNISSITNNDNDNNNNNDNDNDNDYFIDENLHKELAHICPLNHRENKVLLKYALLITSLHQQSKKVSLLELINTLLTQIDYRNYMLQLSDNDSDVLSDKWENIVELLNSAEKYTEKSKTQSLSFSSVLEEFIEFYESFSSISDEDSTNKSNINDVNDFVELMTIHASKGLEFDVVVLSGAEDGILPLNPLDNKQIDEEQRLAYVAITRAKNILIITYRKLCSKVRSNGSHYRIKTNPSRFLLPLKTLPASQCIWVHS